MSCLCVFRRILNLRKTYKNNQCTFSSLRSFTSGVYLRYSCADEPQQTFTEENSCYYEAIRVVRRSENIWRSQRDGPGLKKFFAKCFITHGYSPSYIINLLHAACNVSSCSSEFIYALLMNLDECLKNDEIYRTFTFEQQGEILKCLSRYRSHNLLQLACRIFKINETSTDFREFINNLLEDNKFVEAAFCVGALNIQEENYINKIIVPLLLDSKVYPAVSCIGNNTELQIETCKELDRLLVTTNTTEANRPLATSKMAFKALNSLLNLYKLAPENFKNLCYIRGRAAINLLIKRKLGKSVTEETWESLVMPIVNENPDLKIHLIYKLIMMNDLETALKMMPKLEMQDYDITELVAKAKSIANSKASDNKLDEFDEVAEEKLSEKGNTSHLTFELSFESIKFIDSSEEFIKCVNHISQNYKVIGIDSEWKPHFGLSQDRLSLIQLAVHDNVYILDLISLNDCLSTEHWDMILDRIFGNPNILKLGYGIMADVHMIVENNRGTKGRVVRFSHILDMDIFYNKLQDVYPDQMKQDSTCSKNTKGLSNLCEILLGKPLNKEERLCDWEKRPLTDSQMEYAALDAHCLLKMFDILKQEAAEKKMNFEHLVKVSIYLTNQMWKPKKKFEGIGRSAKTLQIQKPIIIHQFKVVVDFKLESEGEKLRQLGADVTILKESDSENTAMEVSNSEGRVLICSESLWNQVKDRHANAVCFDDFLGDDSPLAAMLSRFNVRLKAKDYFSRCTVCNSDQGIRVSSDNINLMEELLNPKDLTTVENKDHLQNIISEMFKFGISIKYMYQKDIILAKGYAFVCMKCGMVQ